MTKMFFSVALAVATLSPIAMHAQTTDKAELKQFTLEDLNFGGRNFRKMSPENMYLTWWGDQLMYQDAEECGTVDMKKGVKTALMTLDDINTAVGDSTKMFRSLMNATFPYADKTLVLLEGKHQRALYDWTTKTIAWSQLRRVGEAYPDWNPKTRAVAFVRKMQLFVRDGEGNTVQLTEDGSPDIEYGQVVHRDEFGITKGTFWSNDGAKLAFYRQDQSMVTDYPLVNTFTRVAQPDFTPYPMAGMKSHKVTVGVYDMNTGKTLYLNAGDPTDRYFTNIVWSPDNTTIYMIEVNRDQTDAELVAYDAATGDRKGVIYSEHHDKYVQPTTPIVFLPWDDTKFLMQSRKDGFKHIYLFDTTGKELRQITSGKWEVTKLLGFNAAKKSVVITSNEKHDLQNNIYSVEIKSGKRILLDGGEGVHLAYSYADQLSASGKYVFDHYSTPTVPRNIDLINTATAKRVELFSAADPWQGYAVPEYTMGNIKAADGVTDLYYRMVKPVNFDPTKKYPTVIYVYGGPGINNLAASWHWASRSWETYMAQKGYLLFILDNRGTPKRGREFEQVTFRQLGQEEMKDQMKGVEFLRTLPYADMDRLGVHGWSYGGYMTISLMLNYPDVFKVGVAGGPVIDWRYYEVMYGERYMDTPEANPEGYEKTSLLSKAGNLKGKLQIIHGMNDPVVVPQHSLNFLEACILAGTQPDFFVYPGEPHNVQGHKSVHLHERITQYFEDYLK